MELFPGFGECVPSRIFLTKGVGKHREKLVSYEAALRNAQIAQFNLVSVSSIFPPRARQLGSTSTP